ncbi:MAG: stalk domain-containing protein [Clostridia bacterium]
MRKYKQFLIGFLVGAILFSLAPVSAAIEEFILYRADYKVMVNGSEYINQDLPILNYKGNTYAPFRSILEKAGLNVAWNTELGRAEVTSNPTSAQINTGEVNTMAETTTNIITQTPDGITQIDTWEGKKYIGFVYIRNKVREKGYDFTRNNDGSWQLIKGDNVILSNIPMTMTFGYGSVEVNYYVDTMLPFVK